MHCKAPCVRLSGSPAQVIARCMPMPAALICGAFSLSERARASCFQTPCVVKPDARSIGAVSFAQAVFFGLGMQKLAMNSKPARRFGPVAPRFRKRFRDHAALQMFHRG